MKTESMTKTAIMTVMVFLGTYFFKVPIPGGYCHLGDGFLLMGVLLLGQKKGIFAGAVGAAFADLLGGYTMWVLPTLLIKAILAAVVGMFVKHDFPEKSFFWLIGAFLGGLFQVAGYFAADVLLYNVHTATLDLVGNIVQTGIGIAVAFVIVRILAVSGTMERLRRL